MANKVRRILPDVNAVRTAEGRIDSAASAKANLLSAKKTLTKDLWATDSSTNAIVRKGAKVATWTTAPVTVTRDLAYAAKHLKDTFGRK